MTSTTQIPRLRLYDAPCTPQHWMVQDEGTDEWWLVPAAHDGWARRRAIPAPCTARRRYLEPAPGYCYMGIGVPIRREWSVVCHDCEGRN